MNVARDPVLLAADHEGHLAVNLQSDQAVHDVGAGVFQRAGPFDIALLVETGFEFHQNRHLLVFLHGVEQGFDDRRVASHAVQADLDGQYRRIAGRASQKLDDRLERVERVVQQDVALADQCEHVFVRASGQGWRRSRDEGNVL